MAPRHTLKEETCKSVLNDCQRRLSREGNCEAAMVGGDCIQHMLPPVITLWESGKERKTKFHLHPS